MARLPWRAGYACVILVNWWGLPFFVSLPLAFLAAALIGFVLERLLYRHLYGRTHLDQVLFTIGLVFMSVTAMDYWMGSQQVFVQIPEYLRSQIDIFGIGVGRYRLMIIVICGLLTIALQLILGRTRFGSRLRAAVDDPRAAHRARHQRQPGVRADLCLRLGPRRPRRRAGREILGLDPYFPLKFMIYFLIVVSVGGTSTITGAVPGVAAARHRRRCRQVLCAEARRLRDLRHDDRAPALAPERPVRPFCDTVRAA